VIHRLEIDANGLTFTARATGPEGGRCDGHLRGLDAAPLGLRQAIAGGDPAQAAAARAMEDFCRPELAEGLLLGADGSGSGLDTLFAAGDLPSADTEEYRRVLTQPGALTAGAELVPRRQGGGAGRSPPVAVPTLYVWSTGDTALGRHAAEASADFVTGPYQFVVLDGFNHWIPEVRHPRRWPACSWRTWPLCETGRPGAPISSARMLR
jgi:hypothetical protein